MKHKETVKQTAEHAKSLVCAVIELTNSESSVTQNDMDSSDKTRFIAAYEVLRMHDDAANLLFLLHDMLDSMIADYKEGGAG